MSHVKICLPHYKLPRIALPYIRTGSKHHDHYASGDYESVSAISDVHERMEDPPSTWSAYKDKPAGRMTIVEMEYAELMACKVEGSKAGMIKELTDLAAACICAIEKLRTM